MRSRLERQAAEARRSVEDARRAARRDLEERARSPRAATRGSQSAWLGGTSNNEIDDVLLVWALPLAALAALPLVVGHLATLVVHGDWPRYPLGEAPGILGRFATNLGDPARAWEPVNTGAPVPGPVAWWGTFALVGIVVVLLGLLVWAMVRPAGASGGSGWAQPGELREMRVTRSTDDRLVVGVRSGHKVGLPDRRSLLVVGPAHSGKSCGLTIPAILEWKGPVVVAATKGHVIDETIGWRSRQGEVHVYDPAGITPYHRSGWSILADCATWQGAIRTAADLTLAVRGAGISEGAEREIAEGQGDLWRTSMTMALAPYLLATVSSGRSVSAAAGWIQREECEEVLDILRGVDQMAARAHASTCARDDPSRSSFLSAMHHLLSVYDDPVVAASADRHEIVADELLDGGHNTLYLNTPEHDQARFRPLCSMIVRRMIATAYERSAQNGGPLDPPLLVVLDDVLGIAPIYDLASLASTGPARGVQIVSVVQDTEQVVARYGDNADDVIGNHGAKLVLAGRPAGRPFADDLVPAELSDQLSRWDAAFLWGRARPARVGLRPWFRDRELRRRVHTPQDEVRAVKLDPPASWVPVADQTAAWLGRPGQPGVHVNRPSIPMDVRDRRFREVFGSLDEDDTGPIELPPPGDPRRRRR